MIVSYNWLNTFVDVKDLGVEALAKELTLAGFEVETIEYLAKADNLVIGKIIEIVDHPDADTLKITKINIGEEILQIVTGAPNIALNQKVIVAKVGANLNGVNIKKAKLRGVESYGMLCSLSELGVNKKLLSEEQLAGIEVLDEDAKVGATNVLEYLNLDDILIDIDLTPNRSDALAMFNFVREVGAILDRKVSLPQINDHQQGLKTNLKVETKTNKSLQILGQVIKNITIKPSVDWMANILRAHGMQPINNVVDISNIVMLELGQPLHFYDIDKLDKLELIVEEGYSSKYIALDELEYEINKEDLVITSNNEIIGIAGIMGGENSKITDDTKSLLIEAAHFDLAQVRISSRNLNINSEASTRFSKGIDPNAIFDATNRAIDLLIEYADAKNIEEAVVFGERDLDKKKIVTSVDYINNRLGMELSPLTITRIFERLNFNPVEIDNTIVTHIPTYRLDIDSEVDLSEEVIRLYGVDKLESTMPYVLMKPAKIDKRAKIKDNIVNALLGVGYSETITYSLVSQKHIDLAIMPIGDPVALSNPISIDRKYYRNSLFASMLDVLSYNEARKNHEYSLYEIADVYDNHNNRQERLIIAQSAKTQISYWENLERVNNFFSAKGTIEAILHKIGINQQRISIEVNKDETKTFHPYQSAKVFIDNELFGIVGKVHPTLTKEYDISNAIIGEFNLEVIYNSKKSEIKYVEIPRYPGIQRDIALIVKDDVLSSLLVNTIISNGKDLIKSAEVFDVYQGDNIEENHKSIAIRIFYQSNEKTLKDSDISELHDEIIEKLIDKYQVKYRKM